jgi:putative membrane protein
MITREIVIRKKIIKKGAWTVFFIVSFCLAFSALYEIIEWLVALISDQAAEAFLGTQGYVWDTQSDMAIALLGAISALVILPTLHDKQMEAAGFTL